MHVIDMNNLLIRYCFAIPEMVSPDGLLVNGIYGLLRFLKRIKNKPIICCVDKCSANFRKDLYSPYKKNRVRLDPNLYTQIDLMIAVCNNLGITVLSHPNYEADDLIAAVVADSSSSFTVYSTDKDLLQLCVYDHVKLINPFTNKVLTEETIKEKYNVQAKDFTLFLALMGDNSDNIPGISGVGPKTAAKIINEGMEKYSSKFDFSNLELMLELVTLYDKIPLDIDPKPLCPIAWDQQMQLLGFDI